MIKLEQLLKDKREERNLTLDEAAIATKINLEFLKKIEKGEYGDLPSPAYAKGFVFNYAEFLGLSKSQVSALFKRDFDEKKSIKVLPDGMIGSSGFPIRRSQTRRYVFTGLFLIFMISFVIFQARSIFFPPSLKLNMPKEGSVVSREVTVEGNTDSSATVSINNEIVPVDNKGIFKKTIILFPGQTYISVKAVNRSGKESNITRSINVK